MAPARRGIHRAAPTFRRLLRDKTLIPFSSPLSPSLWHVRASEQQRWWSGEVERAQRGIRHAAPTLFRLGALRRTAPSRASSRPSRDNGALGQWGHDGGHVAELVQLRGGGGKRVSRHARAKKTPMGRCCFPAKGRLCGSHRWIRPPRIEKKKISLIQGFGGLLRFFLNLAVRGISPYGSIMSVSSYLSLLDFFF